MDCGSEVTTVQHLHPRRSESQTFTDADVKVALSPILFYDFE